MDSATTRWFSDPGMVDDPSFHQWELNSLDQFGSQSMIWEGIQQSFSSESYNNNNSFHNPPNSSITSNTFSGSSMEYSSQNDTRPNKIPKDSKAMALPKATTTTSSSMLTFGDPESPSDYPEMYKNLIGGVVPKEEIGMKRSYDAMVFGQGTKNKVSIGTRPPSHNQDHIIAERKRREKLSQRFIALSAIVPGLKKMDKASVLGDSIKYLKQLQEKVKTLEEQSTQKPIESAVLKKKSQLVHDDDNTSSCDENFGTDHSDQNQPEIEAKLSEKTVLVKIHCKNHKGCLVKTLAEIESINLSVINTSAIPFASSLDITVMAQIEEGFCMTAKELVKKLNAAFKQFM